MEKYLLGAVTVYLLVARGIRTCRSGKLGNLDTGTLTRFWLDGGLSGYRFPEFACE